MRHEFVKRKIAHRSAKMGNQNQGDMSHSSEQATSTINLRLTSLLEWNLFRVV